MNTLSYDAKWGNYRLILTADDLKKQTDMLHELIRLAHEGRAGQ